MGDAAKLFTQYGLAPIVAGIISFVIIVGIISFVGGVLSARYKWGVEQERDRQKQRRDSVNFWRRELFVDWDARVNIGSSPELKYPFMSRPAYLSLRPHLDANFRKNLENPRHVVVSGGDYPRRQLERFPIRLTIS